MSDYTVGWLMGWLIRPVWTVRSIGPIYLNNSRIAFAPGGWGWLMGWLIRTGDANALVAALPWVMGWVMLPIGDSWSMPGIQQHAPSRKE